jgi:tRNA-splicing ligase RtcB
MPKAIAPNVKAWLVEPLAPEVRTAIQRTASAEDVQRVAIMPDVHLAGDVCIGTVIATSRLIYPAAVGGDVGCGIAAAAFDLAADALYDAGRAAELLGRLRDLVPSIRHARSAIPPLAADLTATPLSDRKLSSIRSRDGVVQFGTLGRGNHFLEFQADDENRLWLMVHSGSRAMGQAIRDFHLARATSESRGMAFLASDGPEGRAYLSDARWARRYARANRRAMVDATAIAIRGLFDGAIDETSYFDCDHNHVQRESHLGEWFWIRRKGANSVARGQRGTIPGSMGTESFHVEGRGNSASLCSSSHGAGRAMSRDEARRRITISDLRSQMGETFFDDARASELRDEAPSAYKNVRAVLRAQKDLVKQVRRLRPVLSYKG